MLRKLGVSIPEREKQKGRGGRGAYFGISDNGSTSYIPFISSLSSMTSSGNLAMGLRERRAILTTFFALVGGVGAEVRGM